MILLTLAFLYSILCVRLSFEGEKRKIGYNRTYFISLLLTPVIASLFVFTSKKVDNFDKSIRSITPIVIGLVAMNFFIFNCELLLPSQIIQPLLMSLGSFSFDKLITHQFIHASTEHLRNNMCVLLLVGPPIERRMKSLQFIIFYLICGSIGGFLQIYLDGLLTATVAGASSSIYGLMGIFVGMKITNKIGKINFPTFLIPLYFIVDEFIISLGHQKDGIGHIAHVAGALTGIIIGYLYERFTKTK